MNKELRRVSKKECGGFWNQETLIYEAIKVILDAQKVNKFTRLEGTIYLGQHLLRTWALCKKEKSSRAPTRGAAQSRLGRVGRLFGVSELIFFYLTFAPFK